MYLFKDVNEYIKKLEKFEKLMEKCKRQQEQLKIANKKIAAQRGQLKMLNKAYIPKSKVKEILGIEEDMEEEKILSLLETIWDEFNRLEDIEDKKVQIEYQNVFNAGVKSVKKKLKELREIDNIDLIQCKLKQILEE